MNGAVNGLNIRVRTEGDVGVVCVDGELDMVSAPVLRRELQTQLRQGFSAVVLDLSGVTFMGSSGLAVLAEARTWATEAQVALRVVAHGPMVRRPMELTGLNRLVATFGSVAEALDAHVPLAGPQRLIVSEA
jgi:anti-sigma B factor antagonist